MMRHVVAPRLRQSERMLRQELLLARAAVAATEQELKSLVERLHGQVDELVNIIKPRARYVVVSLPYYFLSAIGIYTVTRLSER